MRPWVAVASQAGLWWCVAALSYLERFPGPLVRAMGGRDAPGWTLVVCGLTAIPGEVVRTSYEAMGGSDAPGWTLAVCGLTVIPREVPKTSDEAVAAPAAGEMI